MKKQQERKTVLEDETIEISITQSVAGLLGHHTDSITHEHIHPPKLEKKNMRPDDVETDSIR